MISVRVITEVLIMVRKRQELAFTIMELLIAAAITIGIVAFLGTMFSSLMSTASHATQRTDSFRDARSAIQMIERDLLALIHVPSSGYFLVTDNTYSDPVTTGTTNRQIFALCAVKNRPFGAATQAAGDLCAVGYYCRWDTDHYALHRYFRDSAATFAFFLLAPGPETTSRQ